MIARACSFGCAALLLVAACFELRPEEPLRPIDDGCHGDLERPLVYARDGGMVERDYLRMIPTPVAAHEEREPTEAVPDKEAALPRLFAKAPSGRVTSPDLLLVCRFTIEDPHQYDQYSEVLGYLTLGVAHGGMRTAPYAHLELSAGKAAPLHVGGGTLAGEMFFASTVKLKDPSPLQWQMTWGGKTHLGPLHATFTGSLPFGATGKGFSYTCGGYDAGARRSAAAELEKQIDEVLDSDESRAGRGALLSPARRQRLTEEFGELAELADDKDPHVRAAAVALGRASRDDRERSPREVVALTKDAVPLMTWAPIDDTLEARTGGVICHHGGWFICNVELQLRARRSDASLCPADRDRLGLMTFAARLGRSGARSPISLDVISLPEDGGGRGTVLTRREQLAHLQPGEIYSVELMLRGVPYEASRDAPVDWDVPVIEIIREGAQTRAFRVY